MINERDQQFHLGLNVTAQTEYGCSPKGRYRSLETLAKASRKFGQRRLAEAANVSLSEISAVLLGKREPRPTTTVRLHRALASLEAEAREATEHTREVLCRAEEACQHLGLRRVAKRAGVDATNLMHVLNGHRKPSRLMLDKLQASLT